jgi:hypothetical protein
MRPFAISAVKGEKLVVERRSVRDKRLSGVEATLQLPASAMHEVEYLSICPNGEFLLISARAPFIQSFPQNRDAVHTVWILRTNPLELVREYALPKETSLPYWVGDNSFRMEVGDNKNNCVDRRIETDGSVSETILSTVPPIPSVDHATEAACALNDLGFKFVVHHPAARIRFSADTFYPIRRNPIVSRDGKTIVADAWRGATTDSEAFTEVVVLKKRDVGWQASTLAEEGTHMFAIAGEWVAVASYKDGPWRVRVYDLNLDSVVGEFSADAFDMSARTGAAK